MIATRFIYSIRYNSELFEVGVEILNKIIKEYSETFLELEVTGKLWHD
jgi:hypothetical protein